MDMLLEATLAMQKPKENDMSTCCPECNKTMGFPASFIAGFCPSCAGKYITQQDKRITELEDVCRNALTSLTITTLPRLDDSVVSDSDIIKNIISSLKQALKEE